MREGRISKRLTRVIRISGEITMEEVLAEGARVMTPKYKHLVVRGAPRFFPGGCLTAAHKVSAVEWLVEDPSIAAFTVGQLMRFSGSSTHHNTNGRLRIAWVVNANEVGQAIVQPSFSPQAGDRYSFEEPVKVLCKGDPRDQAHSFSPWGLTTFENINFSPSRQ